MGRKILKYFIWTVLTLLGLVLLLLVLLYIPPVQSFVKDRAVKYLSSNLGIELNVDGLRLRFPLAISLDGILVVNEGDTVIYGNRIEASVAVWPLLAKEIRANHMRLENAEYNYRDTVSQVNLRTRLEKLYLDDARVWLGNNRVVVDKAELSDASVFLLTGEGSPKPDTAAAAPGWNIEAKEILLNNVGFGMRTEPESFLLDARLEKSRINSATVDTDRQTVEAELVEVTELDFSYLLAENRGFQSESSANLQAPDSISVPWTILATATRLRDASGKYGLAQGAPSPGFDADYIEVSELNLDIRDFTNRAEYIEVTIERFDFRERSGLVLTEATGTVILDSVYYSTKDFTVKMPSSEAVIDARVGTGITVPEANTPLTVRLRANIGAGDITPFIYGNRSLTEFLKGHTVNIDLAANGTLGNVSISDLQASVTDVLQLDASGNIVSLQNMRELGGNLDFRTNVTDPGQLRHFLSDTALQRRIGFPERLTAEGNISIRNGTYSPDIVITADSGSLNLEGEVNIRSENYNIDLKAVDFPTQVFLPRDSIGPVSLNLTAKGNKFDPREEGAGFDVDLGIDRLEYRSYNYDNFLLRATLEQSVLSGHITSDSEALGLDLQLDGEIRPNIYGIHLYGRVKEADLQRMGFSGEPLGISTYIDLSGYAYPDTTYHVELDIDTLLFRHGSSVERINQASLRAAADPRSVTASVRSSDLAADFISPIGIDSLLPRINSTSKELLRQIEGRNLDMEQLQLAMPPFRVEATAGSDNFLHAMLQERNIGFSKLMLKATTLNDRPFSFSMELNRFTTSGLTLDTLNLWARREDKALRYSLRLRNRPGNIEEMALIRVRGSAEGNTAHAEFYQRNRSDSVGFEFGIDAQLIENGVRASITPEDPLFGYVRWTANPDNYVEYDFDGKLSADLRLNGQRSHVYLQSERLPEAPYDGIRADISGIRIGKALALLPSPPPIDGILTTDIAIGYDSTAMSAAGNISVNEFRYNDRLFGDVGAEIDYRSDGAGKLLRNGTVAINGSTVLSASGSVGNNSELDLSAQLSELPLQSANAFIPENTVELSGTGTGNLRIGGTVQNPDISGQITLSGAEANVLITGTTFGITPVPVTINGSVVSLDGFGIIAPNNEVLSVNGTVDLSDMSNIVTDLGLQAVNFEVVRSSRSGGSEVYGRAAIDADITAKGPVDALAIRGNLTLLSVTDVTWVMREGPISVEDREQDIVTFVSFDEIEFLPIENAGSNTGLRGIDMLVNADIADGVEATINLTENGESRVELEGGGNLTYTLNRQGDSRFTGRYNLSGGTVVYSPPVISSKSFTVQPDSYVEWTGEMTDPVFHVTAVESVKTTVTLEDGTTQSVTFDITVRVRNSLNDMALEFDLAAPGNLIIQTQLQSLAPEQRSQQAIALLVYNTYTGPGTTATIDANNPLNTFISKELNQWARNNLKDVDVSIGINTVDDVGGGQHTDYSYQVSKSLFDERIKVTVGGSVSSGANEDLANNLVDDISLEYRLSKRDNMFLKAYRYNTQESILEGEVVETGLGFVARKKMNKLKELFRLRRDPQKKEMRRVKREIQEQIRQSEIESGIDPAREQRQDDPLGTQEMHSNSPAPLTEEKEEELLQQNDQ